MACFKQFLFACIACVFAFTAHSISLGPGNHGYGNDHGGLHKGGHSDSDVLADEKSDGGKSYRDNIMANPSPKPSPSAEDVELQKQLAQELREARKLLGKAHRAIADHQAWVSSLKDKVKYTNASYTIAMKEILAAAAEEAANAKHVQEVLLQRKLDEEKKANQTKAMDSIKVNATNISNNSNGSRFNISRFNISNVTVTEKKSVEESDKDVKPWANAAEPTDALATPTPEPQEELPSIEDMREDLKILNEQHRELNKLKNELLAEVYLYREEFEYIMDINVFWAAHKDKKKRAELKGAELDEGEGAKVKDAYEKVLKINEMMSKPEGHDSIE